jgi:opacity protein-like surface antigen
MKTRTALGSAFLVMLVASAARAEGFRLIPFVGYLNGGEIEDTVLDNSNIEIESGVAYGLAAIVPLNEQLGLELLYNRHSAEVAVPGLADRPDLDTDYLQVSVLFSFRPGESASPYVGLGLGATRLSPEGDSSDTWGAASLAFGVDFVLSDSLGARLDGRYFGTRVDEDDDLACEPDSCLVYGQSILQQWQVSAGLVIRF